ncbi:iron complex transport system substrate-binding protein [Corynebacterium coyleae]|uniref:ABC transporter substrate-binding protein n=1 Tax=Corynebacterium coyleae TaxID=53374 RepID=A0ABX8KVT3_9CORY|nr:ABC transporter substrate-binding protein [Corynebacterium coyleae]QXB17908.1 ABC transporter substrate-binding protein [Corynebacterium coyleae]WJY79351.1 putative ABC transporter solute-binding protein YclQ precursor [Corynebacterium coyleae]SEB76175.1 iron complex transport system substrate-binding protein [Corynebacterium coyleae]
MIRFPRTALIALAAAGSLTLGACSNAEQAAETTTSVAATSEAATSATTDGSTVKVTDNYGEKEVPANPQRVVALDNRTFELLDAWGVKPVAAARDLVPNTIPGIADDESIVNIGNHKEPNLEAIVAADPDVIVSGQRFRKYDEEIEKLVPNATLVEFEPRDGEPFDRELIRQTLALGDIFGKQTEAEQTVKEFTEAIERARSTYNPDQTVMAVNVSGGEIGYVAPGVGRMWGPLFDLIGFTPALQVENASNDHKGDDISVEAIADANPFWIFALDRDAAIKSAKDSPEALSVINDSAALQNVTAVKENHVYVAPKDTYTNESILTYTEILNDLADKFEAAK